MFSLLSLCLLLSIGSGHGKRDFLGCQRDMDGRCQALIALGDVDIAFAAG